VKPAVFALCLLPVALILRDGFTGHLTAEPIKEITHRTGDWTLRFLVLTLAVTPLRRLTGWNSLVSYRRMLGLFAFFYVCLHFVVIYLVLDKFFAFPEIVKDIAKRPYITVGFTGFLMFLPLAFTSTRASIRRLGKRWVTLHALIYAIALAGVVHFTWSVKADRLRPTVYAAWFLGLLALRLLPREAFAALRALRPLRVLRAPQLGRAAEPEVAAD
jgi:sulfoxide reductase heme-binding subunit YedZ